MSRASTVHTVSAIGIDMGKSTLHMIGLDSSGAIVLREKVSRGRIASRFANLPPGESEPRGHELRRVCDMPLAQR
jgi:transposase